VESLDRGLVRESMGELHAVVEEGLRFRIVGTDREAASAVAR